MVVLRLDRQSDWAGPRESGRGTGMFRRGGIVVWALAAGGLAAVSAGYLWAAEAASTLVVNGKVASRDVRLIGGKAYVPVADIARALGLVVAKTGGGYQLTQAGGANQVEGVRQGKVGDELFTGKWRFQVTGWRFADQYQDRYYADGRTILPKGSRETLVVIDCRVRNGLKTAQSPILTERQPGKTGLADDQDHSYPPLEYDARQAINKTQSYEAESLLPGAAADFALVFSVPQGTKPKALVFSLSTYPKPWETAEVRVSLEE